MAGSSKDQEYPSRHIHVCGRRGVAGPFRFVFWFAFFGTLLPVVCFFVFEGPWMWSWFSPAVVIIEGVLYAICVSFHLYLAFSDPGIIPRPLNPTLDPYNAPPLTKLIPFKDGTTYPLKYCTTCSLYRLPRSVHCGVCDACVDQFDHHCPWTGNCVGKRNYTTFLHMNGLFFLLCLYTCSLLVAKIIVLSLNSPNSGPQAFWEAVTIDPAAPIIVLYSLVFIAFLGQLFVYHIFLSCLGQTTNEYIKRVYRGGAAGGGFKKNPHSDTPWRNLFRRFCGYRMARYIKFHQMQGREDLSPPGEGFFLENNKEEEHVALVSIDLTERGKGGKATTEIISI